MLAGTYICVCEIEDDIVCKLVGHDKDHEDAFDESAGTFAHSVDPLKFAPRLEIP
jgi:hypothetical protein